MDPFGSIHFSLTAAGDSAFWRLEAGLLRAHLPVRGRGATHLSHEPQLAVHLQAVSRGAWVPAIPGRTRLRCGGDQGPGFCRCTTGKQCRSSTVRARSGSSGFLVPKAHAPRVSQPTGREATMATDSTNSLARPNPDSLNTMRDWEQVRVHTALQHTQFSCLPSLNAWVGMAGSSEEHDRPDQVVAVPAN